MIISYSCGGGGYGHPHERKVDKVLHDVKEKWVSVEAARNIYGVEISAEGKLNEAGTQSLRAKMA